MDDRLRRNRYSLLFTLGFVLFLAAVATDDSWLLASATIFVIVAAVGRPLAEVRWPGGAVTWQDEAIQHIYRISYEELPLKVRQAMEQAQREAIETGQGMGATTGPTGFLERQVPPEDFARMAVEAVLSVRRNAEGFVRAKRGNDSGEEGRR